MFFSSLPNKFFEEVVCSYLIGFVINITSLVYTVRMYDNLKTLSFYCTIYMYEYICRLET